MGSIGHHFIMKFLTCLVLSSFVLELAEAIKNVQLTPEQVDVNDPGATQTMTALARQGIVDISPPIVGTPVSFLIESGPNKGVSGSCGNEGCFTDENGMVSFTYQSGFSVGVDKITASIPAGDIGPGTIESNPALVFWDEDCNGNGMADTCDISCSFFNGECYNIVDCGGSADGDGNGIPDECEREVVMVLAAIEDDDLCMEVDGPGNIDDKLRLGDCDPDKAKQQFSYDGTFFRTALDQNLCLQAGRERVKVGKKIRLYPCDPNEPRQKFDFDTVNGGLISLREEIMIQRADQPQWCVAHRGKDADGGDPIVIVKCAVAKKRGWKIIRYL